jgi:hypothetical protein
MNTQLSRAVETLAMKRLLAPLAIVLGLVMAAPLAVNAQQPPQGKKAPAKGGGGARGGGGHPAPRAAPHISAPRVAPHPVVRAAPHVAPRRAAAPHFTPRRAAAPHVTRQRAVVPHVRTQRAATPHVRTQRAATPRATSRPATLSTQQQTRAAQRHERTLRNQENRALRRLPASQRAQRREEINRARRERANQRNAVQPNAVVQPNALAQPNVATAQRNARAQRRALRRNRTAAVTGQAARTGRFAAPFAANARTAGARRARRYHYAARRAWRRGLRAAFIPWYGPVFWPYAYSDIFDYAFWPDGYEDGYWAYAYDDFIDGLFWGEEGPPDEYVEYAEAPPPRPRYAAVQDLCKQPGTGITAWPFAEIERKLDLTGEQRALLGDVRDAAGKAASVFRDSCPAENAYPLTPPGRLRAMTGRLQATLDAVQTVRPPLERFYNSLTDEQKERFNELGPTKLRINAEARAALPADAKTCTQAKPGLTNLPIEQIDNVVAPSEAQEKLLDNLEDATAKAVSILQAACPDETPLTPPGRLAAMQARLQAMIDAANAVRPALDDFYASLTSEQKARFNRIGRTLAKAE